MARLRRGSVTAPTFSTGSMPHGSAPMRPRTATPAQSESSKSGCSQPSSSFVVPTQEASLTSTRSSPLAGRALIARTKPFWSTVPLHVLPGEDLVPGRDDVLALTQVRA